MIDAELARSLVVAQFPQWAHLPVVPVEVGGVDNRTFRLGDELTIRMPSAEHYAQQVAKEQRWLPVLAPRLPLPIPLPVARGGPGPGYPFSWSVLRWIEGHRSERRTIGDLTAFGTATAAFLVALRGVDPTGGPPPGAHNFHRGGPLSTYADETLRAVDRLGAEVPRDAVLDAWGDAMARTFRGAPVWFHGDVAEGNLLVRDGRLAAVIDFGCSGVGDPACDVVLAWTLLSGAGRDAFRRTLAVDDGTWARGRGWALWKALITLPDHLDAGSPDAEIPRRVIREILEERSRDR